MPNIAMPDIRYEDERIIVLDCMVGEKRDDLVKLSGALILANSERLKDQGLFDSDKSKEHKKSPDDVYASEQKGIWFSSKEYLPKELREAVKDVKDVKIKGLLVVLKVHRPHFSGEEKDFIIKLLNLMGYEVKNWEMETEHAVSFFRYNPHLDPYH